MINNNNSRKIIQISFKSEELEVKHIIITINYSKHTKKTTHNLHSHTNKLHI